MVTLELALVIPTLLLICLFAAWLLRIGQVQAQLDDATRSAARQVARGAGLPAARAAGNNVLPGVGIDARPGGGAIEVEGRYHLQAPLPVLSGLGAHLHARTVVAAEPQW
jgi:hypothetical protein